VHRYLRRFSSSSMSGMPKLLKSDLGGKISFDGAFHLERVARDRQLALSDSVPRLFRGQATADKHAVGRSGHFFQVEAKHSMVGVGRTDSPQHSCQDKSD